MSVSKVFQKLNESLPRSTTYFIIIACLIIGVYGAMLLPIYGNMEGVL